MSTVAAARLSRCVFSSAPRLRSEALRGCAVMDAAAEGAERPAESLLVPRASGLGRREARRAALATLVAHACLGRRDRCVTVEAIDRGE